MKKIKQITSIITTAIIFLSFTGNALALSLQWTQTYTPPTTDSTYGGNPGNMALDSSGNIYITGLYKSGVSTGFITRKYNPSGGLLWSQFYTFGTSGVQAGRGVAVHPSTGDVYVMGPAVSTGYGHWRFVQYDSSGNYITTWTYEQAVDRTEIPGYGLVIDSSGNIYSVGNDRSCGVNYCFVVIKFSSNGTFLQKWNSAQISSLNVGTIDKDSSNNIYVFGEGTWYPTGSTPHSMIGIKYSNTGTKLQDYIFNKTTASIVEAYGKVDSSGNVYLQGENRNSLTFDMDRALVKFNNSGTKLWDTVYNGWTSGSSYGNDKGFGFDIDSSGSIYSTGRSRDPGNPGLNRYGTLNILFNSSGVYQDRNYYTSSSLSRLSDKGKDVIYHAGSNSIYILSDDNLSMRLSKLGLACNGPLTFGNWPTDHPTVTAGVTPIKTAHVTDIRDRINLLEVDAGISPTTTWTDPSLVGVGIKAAHINQMRTAINTIYSTCGQTPLPSWSDGTNVSIGTGVRAQHINELRQYVEQAK